MVDRLADKLIVNRKREADDAVNQVRNLNIKVSSISQRIDSLSGGNQQKAMIAKWLSLTSRIIFMDEPTRGIDVAAKAEIHAILRELSNAGIGVVIISSELSAVRALRRAADWQGRHKSVYRNAWNDGDSSRTRVCGNDGVAAVVGLRSRRFQLFWGRETCSGCR